MLAARLSRHVADARMMIWIATISGSVNTTVHSIEGRTAAPACE
jgi:hypothetical protein